MLVHTQLPAIQLKLPFTCSYQLMAPAAAFLGEWVLAVILGSPVSPDLGVMV